VTRSIRKAFPFYAVKSARFNRKKEKTALSVAKVYAAPATITRECGMLFGEGIHIPRDPASGQVSSENLRCFGIASSRKFQMFRKSRYERGETPAHLSKLQKTFPWTTPILESRPLRDEPGPLIPSLSFQSEKAD